MPGQRTSVLGMWVTPTVCQSTRSCPTKGRSCKHRDALVGGQIKCKRWLTGLPQTRGACTQYCCIVPMHWAWGMG